MADFLDETRSEIGARLSELKPLVEEYERLQAAAAALDSVPTATVTSTVASGRAARGSATASPRRRAAPTGTPRGRPKGSGTRGNQALELVKANPGITISELAKKMGIKRNYLHQVLPALAQDGLVTKDGRGWHPNQAA